MQGEKIKATLHAREHAERQAIDLHELQDVDIVLVPFDHLPVGHCRRLNRDEFVEAVMGQNEAARMLRQVARCAHQLPCQVQRQAQSPVRKVEIELLGMFLADVLAPAPNL
ncbi:hypothetical protein D9M70_527140 [compost metagenome]